MRKVSYDISREIGPGSVVYPGDDPLGLTAVCTIGSDAPCNITSLTGWTTHFLTHLDAPRHFIPDGATLDEVDLSRLITPAIVVEANGATVTAADVPSNIQDQAVLFRTRNSEDDSTTFNESHVYIDDSAIDALLAGRPNLVGIDYLSVDRYGDEDFPVHRNLLAQNILILEGLALHGVPAGTYELVALPLKIKAADGSPVRAVLVSM